jgi:xanthine dehydrogenase accessory factor
LRRRQGRSPKARFDGGYVAFVGSRLKAQTLKAALAARGVDSERLTALRAPAGLDLGAIGPEEIAPSPARREIAARNTPLFRTAGAGLASSRGLSPKRIFI